MYYLMDENLDFILLVKEYLDMIQARAIREVSPNTIKHIATTYGISLCI